MTTAILKQFPDPNLSYGPSLRKGTAPPPILQPQPTLAKPSVQYHTEDEQPEEDYSLNEESFVRVFDIAALRLPAKDCFAYERQLRGHLLNWPRIRNIARVPGDDVVGDLVELVGNRNENVDDGGALVSLNRRIHGKAEGDGDRLSPVRYREELAKTFNSRGFVNFRNLERMSRPKKKKKKKRREGEKGEGNKRVGARAEFAVVEVVEDEEQEGEDVRGLLGDEFKANKWRGPTRLLLLDERHAHKSAEELPEAIKVSLPTP